MLQGSSERVERLVDIYDSADGIKGHNSNTKYEDTERRLEAQQTGGDRWYTLTAACVVLLCVLLLTSIILLWIKYNTQNTEYRQLHTSINNLTIKRDQLQTCYSNLPKELQQARDEYLRTFCDLGRDKGKCFNFSSSFYFMSDGKKNWTDSRQDCRDKGAELVIINSQEEQEFIIKLLEGVLGAAWMGLGRDKEQEWKWVDGTLLTTKSWAVGEQNNKDDKDCAVIHTSPPKGWHRKRCSEKQDFICEKCLST